MRIVLGAMRLSTTPDRDDERARATLEAAFDAGVRVVDTARAYGLGGDDLGHNERLVARASAGRDVAIITKCGMSRDGGAWIPDGRASRIDEDARASVEALGRAPDLLLLHAPDPRVPLATSARALARAKARGLARAVGLSNVSRRHLVEASEHVRVEAVEIALGAYDDLPVRAGVVAWCLERGIRVLAHAPLGGPDRARRLAKDAVLASIAQRLDASPIEAFVAWLLGLHPSIEPVVGVRSRESTGGLARAAALELDDEAVAALDARFPVLASVKRPAAAPIPVRDDAEVVLVMGIPGAGKSTAAAGLAARGYARLNRDSLGGSLKGIVKRLDTTLASGVRRVVLDNTYVTRAVRSDVIRVARAHGVGVRCLFHDTPLPEAQVNVVHRMIARFGRVLDPEEIALRAKGKDADPNALAPHALFRMARELERPEADEGFTSIERAPFVRRAPVSPGRAALAVAASALEHARVLVPEIDGPVLVYAWMPGATPAAKAELGLRARALADEVEIAICPHPAGPPVCWCRPPLPAMWLAFEHARGVDRARSVLVGQSAADRAMAGALGLRFAGVPAPALSAADIGATPEPWTSRAPRRRPST